MHFEYRYLYLSKSYLSFHRRHFRNQPFWNKNCLWRPCLFKHGHHRQLLFLIGWFLRIFSSETVSQMIRNLVGSIYARSSIKIADSVPIRYMATTGDSFFWLADFLDSSDASYQVSVHLAKRFYRRFFRNQPIRNKNCQWWPCLLMDRYEMSNHNRRLSIDASYQVSVHVLYQDCSFCPD
jgi:Zn-finger protein